MGFEKDNGNDWLENDRYVKAVVMWESGKGHKWREVSIE